LHVDLADHELTVLTDADSDLRPGDEVSVRLKDPLYFDATGRRLRAA
jgi:multiple sugar transport system ATP-binding protein